MKTKMNTCGYSNVSEYIRDLLRHDLRLVQDQTADNYPYDYAYINQLAIEANKEYHAGKSIRANSIDEAITKIEG